MKEGSCALCVVALKPLIVELCFIHQKIGDKYISDYITFITISKSSDLLLRKSTNLNNSPRTCTYAKRVGCIIAFSLKKYQAVKEYVSLI